MLTLSQFDRLTKAGYSHIPLVSEVLADMETPLSVYLKLADQPYSYLLESVQGGEKWGRYSIIGLPSSQRLEIRGHLIGVFSGAQEIKAWTAENPLDELRKFKAQFHVPDIPQLPRFNGGLVGYFGYDTVSYIEPHLGVKKKQDPLNAPDILLMVSKEVVVFDNLSGRLFVVVHVPVNQQNAYDTGRQRLNDIIKALSLPLDYPTISSQAPELQTKPESSFSKENYQQAVETCRQYIHDGDAFQIVLSQRLSLPFTGRSLDLYRALRTLNPSPYMYFMNLGDFQVAGSSPEILVRIEEGEITLRPIAGTRKRGEDDEKDQALEKELLADEKELAEHLMLVDLGRNDVGRVAEIGSVVVTDRMTVEKYSHVMHIVSNVTGKIKSGLDAIDVLKATFPAGTLSGAPKVRAMEIIESLEPDKRGIYSGAIGYIGWNGNMDTAIAIRTALIKDNMVYIQAGAGIVLDSVPSSEWQETMNKGQAVLKAVEMVNKGLHNPFQMQQEPNVD